MVGTYFGGRIVFELTDRTGELTPRLCGSAAHLVRNIGAPSAL